MLLNGLAMHETANFDIRNSAIVIRGGYAGVFGDAATSSYDGITGMIARAYNFGAWDLPGLTTSLEGPSDNVTGVGIANADDAGVAEIDWRGVSMQSGDIMVAYAYAGDANLDGVVDVADYGAIDNWIQFPGTTGYANGDFNFDGVIDVGDYGVIDNTIQLQGPPLV